MKRYCKNIDITDINLIRTAVCKCLQGKYKRRDTISLLYGFRPRGIKLTKREFMQRFHTDMEFHSLILDRLARQLRKEMINKSLDIIPIRYHDKLDNSSRKIRHIGIQNIKQQLYDYIAVEGLTPVLKRIGEFQCASVKGRGQIYGTRTIRRWLRNKNIKYAGKLDIRKCYESIDHDKLMAFLSKHIKNDNLLYLIETLIDTFDSGLSIGSYLSQFLCNSYLSELYHEIAENMYRMRKHKDGTCERINLVKHVLFYADDILILGTNSKDLHKAISLIIEKANEMGLEIKPTWVVFKLKISDRKKSVGQFIDMMGFRIYRWIITIRRRVFLRIRRAFKKALKFISLHKPLPIDLAKRCLAYWGELCNTNSFKLMKKYKIQRTIYICKKVVSNYDKSKIYGTAGFC